MSMIHCMYCDGVGDCKDAWIEGVFNPDPPFDFICPTCKDLICEDRGLHDADILDDDDARDIFAAANGRMTRHEREQAYEEDRGDYEYEKRKDK